MTPWTAAPGKNNEMGCHAPLQDLPDQGIKLTSPVSYTAGRFFTAEAPGKPVYIKLLVANPSLFLIIIIGVSFSFLLVSVVICKVCWYFQRVSSWSR